uniref:DUF6535 domain-containing protein n=1 Tax=Moniliophthora roreri TaxID=221103 RepID=A0A0W0FDC1_MONRR
MSSASSSNVRVPFRRSESSGSTLFGIQRENSFPGYRPHTRDYEQEYPEDAYGEEIGSDARVWMAYLDESGLFDMEMLSGWKDTIDVLLVFAGLFSAVVTTFVVQTTQALEPDYVQITAFLLQELVAVQRAAATGQSAEAVQRSSLNVDSQTHSATDVWINALWLISLSFSLTTALIAVLVKQWIQAYISFSSGPPRDHALIRQYRYMGIQRWKVPFIIGFLPVLLHLALFIFLAGLVLFLSSLHTTISWMIGTQTLLCFVLYIASNILPLIYPDCPYKSYVTSSLHSLGLSLNTITLYVDRVMEPMVASAVNVLSTAFSTSRVHERDVLRRGLRSTLAFTLRFFTRSTRPPESHTFHQPRGSENEESTHVQNMGSLLVAESLIWLYNTSSSNPMINNIAVQALAGLPPDFSHIFLLRKSGVYHAALHMLRGCFSLEKRIKTDKHGTAERLARACIQLEPSSASILRLYSHEFYKKGKEIHRPDYLAISAISLDRAENPFRLSELFNEYFDKPEELCLTAAVWKDILRVVCDGRQLDLPTQWSIARFLFRNVGSGYVQYIPTLQEDQKMNHRHLTYINARAIHLKALRDEDPSFKRDIARALHAVLKHNSPKPLDPWQLNHIYLNLYHLQRFLDLYQNAFTDRLDLVNAGLAIMGLIEPHARVAFNQVTFRHQDVLEFVSEILRIREGDIYPVTHSAFLGCDGLRNIREYFEDLDIQEKRSDQPDLWRAHITLARLVYAYLDGVFPEDENSPGDQVHHIHYLLHRSSDFDYEHLTWCRKHLGHILYQSSDNVAQDHAVDPRLVEHFFPRFFNISISGSPQTTSSEEFIPPPPSPSPPPAPFIPN